MRTRTLFCGYMSIGTSLCLASYLRLLYVRAAWAHESFCPNFDIDTPALFFGLGMLFIAVSVLMTLVDWLLAHSGKRNSGEG